MEVLFVKTLNRFYIKKTVEVFELIDNVYRSVSKNKFELTDDCAVELNGNEIF